MWLFFKHKFFFWDLNKKILFIYVNKVYPNSCWKNGAKISKSLTSYFNSPKHKRFNLKKLFLGTLIPFIWPSMIVKILQYQSSMCKCLLRDLTVNSKFFCSTYFFFFIIFFDFFSLNLQFYGWIVMLKTFQFYVCTLLLTGGEELKTVLNFL